LIDQFALEWTEKVWFKRGHSLLDVAEVWFTIPSRIRLLSLHEKAQTILCTGLLLQNIQ